MHGRREVPVDRRQVLVGLAGLAGVAGFGGITLGACTDGGDPAETPGEAVPATLPADPDAVLPAPGSPGLVDEAAYQARIDEYLTAATAGVDPSSPTSILAALIAARRDPGFRWEPARVRVETLAEHWDRIDEWQDTRDFTLMYLFWIRSLADGSTPTTTLDPAVLDAIDRRLVDNRYRYDDPLPEGRVDQQWFWSENHVIILATLEYLAGRRLPEQTFPVTGLTGAEHAARTKDRILAWVDERVRFGFFEWHSTTYMRKNLEALATLVEFADDPELVQAAAIGLDLCLLDVAGHTHAGTYTATQGRDYHTEKPGGLDGNSDVIRLAFGSPLPFTGAAGNAVNHLAGATRYRPPQVLVELAAPERPGVTRERHGIFVDGAAPVTEDPEAPFGYDFDDPDNLEFWWSQGAVGLWQLTRTGLAEAERFRLLESDLLAEVQAIVALNGGDPERIRAWLQRNHDVVNFGHLREVDTYTWRGPHGTMSSALDHRPGQMRDQIRSWEARLAGGPLVFTQHPAKPPPPDGLVDDAKPGYWTGEASIPRSAQVECTSVHVYLPAWDATNVDPVLWSVFGYRDETHAFVPAERFDELVRTDPRWTFARRGDGYLALWSWRPVDWRAHPPAADPAERYEGPFDLVAGGGADNVWICELGDRESSGSFAGFVNACLAEAPDVRRDDAGFAVTWRSPSAGTLVFGSTGPFTVEGREVPLQGSPRHESFAGTVDRLATTVSLRTASATLTLDAGALRREVGGPG